MERYDPPVEVVEVQLQDAPLLPETGGQLGPGVGGPEILLAADAFDAALRHHPECGHAVLRAECRLDAPDQIVRLQHEQHLPVDLFEHVGDVWEHQFALVLDHLFLMLPGWGSLCTKPFRKIMFEYSWPILFAMSYGSSFSRWMYSRSFTWPPFVYSIMSTRDVVYSQITPGIFSHRHWNLKSGNVHATSFTSTSIVLMSTIELPLTYGCCTFTATSRPSRSVARCTWASDAVPSGSGSNDSNSSFGSTRKSCRMTRYRSSTGFCGALLCSTFIVLTYSGGRRDIEHGRTGTPEPHDADRVEVVVVGVKTEPGTEHGTPNDTIFQHFSEGHFLLPKLLLLLPLPSHSVSNVRLTIRERVQAGCYIQGSERVLLYQLTFQEENDDHLSSSCTGDKIVCTPIDSGVVEAHVAPLLSRTMLIPRGTTLCIAATGHTLVSELSFSTNLFDFGSTTSSLTVKCGIRWMDTVSDTSFWMSWKVQPSESGRDSSSSQISAQLWFGRRSLSFCSTGASTRYFCSARAIDGKIAWAASCGSSGMAGGAAPPLPSPPSCCCCCDCDDPPGCCIRLMCVNASSAAVTSQALVVRGIPAPGVGGEDGTRLTLLLSRCRPVHVVVLEGRDGGRFPLGLRNRQPLEVWVVDAELGVVSLQHPNRRPLDAQLADAVAVRLAVRAAYHLHVVERLQVANLEQHDRHVMHEQQRVAVAGGVRDQRLIVDHGRSGHDRAGPFRHLHDVEQPKNARHNGDRLAQEQSPQADGQQQQPSGQRHQHALTLRIARQQPQPLVL
uniref:Uncharacterized protein n=1 Tax=Anopheles farauti TaxID=69004 RepID=A0A182QGP0_9DIPT